MDVSENSGFSPQIIFTIHFGVKSPIFGNIHIFHPTKSAKTPCGELHGVLFRSLVGDFLGRSLTNQKSPGEIKKAKYYSWLVVSTHLKNTSQNE